ncbi:MAG: 4Fe-4S binding protein [Rickettsiales bacterium]|jgi:ferredoxin|nr:4Fe-4S binding protein [Rickettsiales bacterium]
MPYKIDPNKCIVCGTCAGVCPVAAISNKDGKYWIDPALCISCGTCAGMCPVAAIAADIPAPNVAPMTPPAE